MQCNLRCKCEISKCKITEFFVAFKQDLIWRQKEATNKHRELVRTKTFSHFPGRNGGCCADRFRITNRRSFPGTHRFRVTDGTERFWITDGTDWPWITDCTDRSRITDGWFPRSTDGFWRSRFAFFSTHFRTWYGRFRRWRRLFNFFRSSGFSGRWNGILERFGTLRDLFCWSEISFR